MQNGKDLPDALEPHAYIHFFSNLQFQLKQFVSSKSYTFGNPALTNINEYEYTSTPVEY